MRLKRLLLLWLLATGLGLGSGLAADGIYEWIDADGVRHFTDGPPPPGAQRVEGLSETPSDPEAPQAGAVEEADSGQDEAPNPDADVVEGGDQDPAGREAFWRRRGWGDDPANPEEPGGIGAGENAPNGSGNAGAVQESAPIPDSPDNSAPAEGGENSPPGDDYWRSRGW